MALGSKIQIQATQNLCSWPKFKVRCQQNMTIHRIHNACIPTKLRQFCMDKHTNGRD